MCLHHNFRGYFIILFCYHRNLKKNILLPNPINIYPKLIDFQRTKKKEDPKQRRNKRIIQKSLQWCLSTNIEQVRQRYKIEWSPILGTYIHIYYTYSGASVMGRTPRQQRNGQNINFCERNETALCGTLDMQRWHVFFIITQYILILNKIVNKLIYKHLYGVNLSYTNKGSLGILFVCLNALLYVEHTYVMLCLYSRAPYVCSSYAWNFQTNL